MNLLLTLLLAASTALPPQAASTPAADEDQPAIKEDGTLHVPDRFCVHSADGWFFLGPDGLIGIAKDSCDAAFASWRSTGKPPKPLSRA